MDNYTITRILKDPSYFSKLDFKDKTVDLAILMVSSNPNSLEFIPKEFQTDNVCEIALKKNALSLKFIQNPTLHRYKLAISKSGNDQHNSAKTITELLDMIPIFDIMEITNMCEKTLYNILVRTPDDYLKDWLKKFPLIFWTESKLFGIVNNNNTACLGGFIDFMIESKISISDRMKKPLFGVCMCTRPELFEIDSELIKWYLISNTNISQALEQKWTKNVEMTFSDVYKIKNKYLALKLCKTLTNEIIRYGAIENHWFVINLCLERNALNGDLLTNIIESAPLKTILENPQKRFTLNNVANLIDHDNFEQLDKICFTVQQLAKIQNKCPLLATRIINHNLYFKHHDKVVIVDKTANKRYVAEKWNILSETVALQSTHCYSITYKFNNGIYKIYQNMFDGLETKLKTVIVLA